MQSALIEQAVVAYSNLSVDPADFLQTIQLATFCGIGLLFE